MFITTGPLPPGSPLFVGREAELTRMQAWVDRANCVGAVLGGRQTGKTSLLLQLRARLRETTGTVYIDFEGIQGANLLDCYTYLARELLEELGDRVTGTAPALPRTNGEFLSFLRALARQTPLMRVVVLLEEIGALPNETALNLSHTIRAAFTDRMVKPEFAKYMFLVCGGKEMLNLATAITSPLMNVTETLYLENLTREQADRLLRVGWEGRPLSPEVGERIYFWTGGHPYWTQLVGELLVERHDREPAAAAVDATVAEIMETETRNLPHILKALTSGSSDLVSSVKALADGQVIPFSRNKPETAELELIGVIRNERGHCAFTNQIYAMVLAPRLGARTIELTQGHLRVDTEGKEVWTEGRRLDPPLSLRQFRLLELLYRNSGKVCDYQVIGNVVWPEENQAQAEGMSDERIHKLADRIKLRLRELNPTHEYIVNIRGHGFKFLPD